MVKMNYITTFSMSLKAKIQEDLITAMKAKEQAKMDALRMLKTAIMKFETSGEAKEATDEEILQMVQKEIKQRQDSVEQYEKGGRPELAAKEKEEIAFLKTYLPPQLSEEEIKKIVEDTIKEAGVTSKQEMGKLMGALMPKVKGKADGKLVSQIVNQLLQ
ncbi:MAG: GatB/YqeY domain-containing protein [Candidatus Gracilibacteria bacterium]|jgi:hypothetical protein